MTRGDFPRAHATYTQLAQIKERLKEPKWSYLPARVRQQRGSEAGESGTKKKEARFPGTLNATVIDPRVGEEIAKQLGVYSTWQPNDHPLSKSTVVDNCGALHLVNDLALLVPDSIVPAKDGERVDAGTGSWNIEGWGTRILPYILTSVNGPKTEDLILTNVAIVRKFYINIILETCLNKVEV